MLWNEGGNQAAFIPFANFISLVFCDQAADSQPHANATCLETDVYWEVSVLGGGVGGARAQNDGLPATGSFWYSLSTHCDLH